MHHILMEHFLMENAAPSMEQTPHLIINYKNNSCNAG